MAQGATLEHSRLDHGVIVELLSLWRQRLQAVYGTPTENTAALPNTLELQGYMLKHSLSVTQTLSLRPPTLRQKYEPQYDHQILSV